MVSVDSGLEERSIPYHERHGNSCFPIERLNMRSRFALPLVIVILAKVGGAISLSHFLNLSASFTYWMKAWEWADQSMRLPFLFLGWDSEWYLRIALFGYFKPSLYAFFPGYPISIYILNLAVSNVSFSAALCSLIFGVAWIPLFQAIAEHYMLSSMALRCALIAAIYPYVFVFTTVAYSESLFLFASIASWYFYLKDKVLYASLLAALATITRTVGILIVLPMFFDLLRRREWKHLLYTFVSPTALFSWFYYCYINTGDWLAPITAQMNWGWTPWIIEWITNRFAAGIALIILTFILISYCRRVDWRLTTYTISYFFVILFASVASMSRFLSFVFPLWIMLMAKIFGRINPLTQNTRWIDIVITVLCVLFFSTAVWLWNRFLMGMWIA